MRNKFIKNAFSAAFLATCTLAIANSDFQNKAFTIGYFNGVWNTPAQARIALNKIQQLKSEGSTTSAINYEVFYNTTGCNTGANTICVRDDAGNGFSFQDLAEVFTQRAIEADDSGELGQRMEYFWESLHEEKTLAAKLGDLLPVAASMLTQLQGNVMNRLLAGASALFSRPPTDIDYGRHSDRLKELAAQGQKMVLVGHSQGNLFLNHAFDVFQPTSRESCLAPIHVAPASPTLRGDYVLADVDTVINGLRPLGVGLVPAANLSMPFSLSDPSGHSMVGTYLDKDRGGDDAVARLINSSLVRFDTNTNNDDSGPFKINLSWSGGGDVALVITEPGGKQVSTNPAEASGDKGFISSVAADTQSYKSYCDSYAFGAGTYRVGIQNFTANPAGVATLQVSSRVKGLVGVGSFPVGTPLGSGDSNLPTMLFDLVVTKDPKTGLLSYAIQ